MILEFARAHFWPLFWTASGILAAVIAFTIWYVLTEPAHDVEPWEDGWQVEPVEEDTWNARTADERYDDANVAELPVPDGITYRSVGSGLATGATHIPASNMTADGGLSHDEWEALDPDQAAATLIAEWHAEPAERTVTRDVWDEWWNGLDGLDRECLTVTRWREREERLWAELKAETDDLCPLAMAA